MADIDERIAQFRNMAEADPENEMAHFSLGNALMQAGRAGEAAPSFEKAAKLNPQMSKALQLAGEAYKEAGESEKAIPLLSRGYEIAAQRGDVLVREQTEKLLSELGAPIPEVEIVDAPTIVEGGGDFVCNVTGRPGTKMEKPPFKGKLGEKIAEHVTRETWQMWIGQGTKVINELRLDLSRPEHQNIYDQHMIEFLGLEEWARENLQESA